jgi:hypothetical protein
VASSAGDARPERLILHSPYAPSVLGLTRDRPHAGRRRRFCQRRHCSASGNRLGRRVYVDTRTAACTAPARSHSHRQPPRDGLGQGANYYRSGSEETASTVRRTDGSQTEIRSTKRGRLLGMTCAVCGAVLTRRATGWPRLYCSDRCRWLAWNEREHQRWLAENPWAVGHATDDVATGRGQTRTSKGHPRGPAQEPAR